MADIPLESRLQERFAKLPKVVQDAITSADVEKHLRELSEHHKLHLDQWELLENEVMLSLLGFQPTAELAANIEKHVGVDADTAAALAVDVSTIVFEPIRKELERGLDHPDAVAAARTGVETMRDEILSREGSAAPVAAATPAVDTAAAAPVAAQITVAPIPVPLEGSTPAPSTPIAAIVAATPPAPVPNATVERSDAHPNYSAGAASHERKAVAGDPYREQIV